MAGAWRAIGLTVLTGKIDESGKGSGQARETAAVPKGGDEKCWASAYGNSINVLTPDGQSWDLSRNMCVWNFELFCPCFSGQWASQQLLKLLLGR